MDHQAGIPPIAKRPVTYLRVSVTDRCNLRCFYCNPVTKLARMDHREILTYEEILRVIRVAASLGVSKVRITGGEPLVRKNVESLVERAASIPGIRELCLTTNGTLLDGLALPLYRAGLNRLNVSLDSLNPATFFEITKRDSFARVFSGIEAAQAVGFSPLKINMVVMAGLNDHEICDMAGLSLNAPVWVRFIEFMPIGGATPWTRERVVEVEEVKKRLEEKFGSIEQAPASGPDDGPALMFRLPGAIGRVGFIGAVSGHFCASCNRMRLTSDGKLKPCLFSRLEVDVKGPLRKGCDDTELAELFNRAVAIKPLGRAEGIADNRRPMGAIGG